MSVQGFKSCVLVFLGMLYNKPTLSYFMYIVWEQEKDLLQAAEKGDLPKIMELVNQGININCANN